MWSSERHFGADESPMMLSGRSFSIDAGSDRGPTKEYAVEFGTFKMLFATISWGRVAYGLVRGSAGGRSTPVERARRPFVFWVNMFLFCALGLTAFWRGVDDLISLPARRCPG